MIACDLHDYVEIACLFGYLVGFELKSGQVLTAIPLTTQIGQGQREFLLLKSVVSINELTQDKILLTELRSMTVLTENARFSYIEF